MADSYLRAIARGRVQGVYFRAFVRDHALRLGLKGVARNLPDGAAVEVEAEGDRGKLEELVRLLWVGPPGAKVLQVETQWGQAEGRFSDFLVL